MAPVFPVLLVSIFLCPLSIEAQEYYVTPTLPPNPDCPSDKPCHTLSYYSSNVLMFNGQENVILLFLDGLHKATTNFSVYIVGSLTIAAVNHPPSLENSNISIKVNLNIFSESITILDIHFQQCMLSIKVEQWFEIQGTVFENTLIELKSSTSKGALINNSNFMSTKVNIALIFSQNTTTSNYTGIMAADMIVISNAVFTSEQNITTLFCFSDLSTLDSQKASFLMSNITSNGINMIIAIGNVSLNLIDSQFSNASPESSGLMINATTDTDLQITDCVFANSGNSGLDISFGTNLNLLISNSAFINNDLFGFMISGWHKTVLDIPVNITMRDCNFTQNQASYNLELLSTSANVLMQNVQFVGNFKSQDDIDGFGNVLIFGPAAVTIDSCLFDDNYGISTLITLNSNIVFVGDTIFSNNVGISGGALMLLNTTIWLESGTHLSFINNTAREVGGAIWISEEEVSFYSFPGVDYMYPPCFYQLMFDLPPLLDNYPIPVSLSFESNHAGVGGDNIHGAALRSDCTMTPNRQIGSYQVRDEIFCFKKESLSSVTSRSKRVCLCSNGVPQCARHGLYHQVSVTAGEMFNLSIALVGNDFGVATGSVYALDTEEDTFLFSPNQVLQQIVNLRCTNVQYSVHPISHNLKTAEFLLSIDSTTAAVLKTIYENREALVQYELALQRYDIEQEIAAILLTTPVFVNVTILDCPLGLELSNVTLKGCVCREDFEGLGVNCSVENKSGRIYRDGDTWIGVSHENKSVILANSYCPFDYCKLDRVGVELTNPDTQCSLNRIGVLCGGCPPNLSLAIGSAKCLYCPDNNGVGYFALFAIGGIIIALLIKILDMTVAHGSINGLILYANIVWTYQGTFFSRFEERLYPNGIRFLIAWLNLDFGIQRCFIQGLDAYTKTWLQFIFPVYLWLIAALIVVACHYSVRVTKLFGNNAVAVLTTLFLLSYVKLLRTIMFAFGAARLIEYPLSASSHSGKLVWLLDGNYVYFGFPHALLFTTAALVLVFVGVPFTLTLLFVGHLNKIPSKRFSRIVVKFRPLLDTYTGPFKNRHQYWVGLTLLIRAIFSMTAAIFQGLNPTINLSLIIVFSTILCILVTRVYKKLSLCLLELVFLLNLIIVSVAYLSSNNVGYRIIFTSISASVSILLLVGILLYHVVLLIKPKISKCHKRLRKRNNDEIRAVNPIQENITLTRTPTSLYIDWRDDILITCREE